MIRLRQCTVCSFLLLVSISGLAQPPIILDAPRNFAVGCPAPLRILPMDLDDDTDIDVAVLCFDPPSDSLLRLLENPGDGTLSGRTSISLSDGVVDVAARDLDSDGRTDLVVIATPDALTGQLQILTRNGPFAFSIATQALPFVPNKLCTGNLDGANNGDLVIGDAIAPHNSLHVYLAGPASGYALQGSYDTEQVIRDTDGDGFLDVQCAFSFPGLACVDLNGNGLDDIAATNSMYRIYGITDQELCSENAESDPTRYTNVVRLLNQGDGSLGPYAFVLDNGGVGLAAADLGRDGDNDLATTAVSISGPDREDLVLIRNLGGGLFGPERLPSGAGLDNLGSVALGDVDADGAPELLVPFRGSPYEDVEDRPTERWGLYRNNGTGGVAAPNILPSGAGVIGIAVADLDQDGDPDLAVANDDDTVLGHFASLSLLSNRTVLTTNCQVGPVTLGPTTFVGTQLHRSETTISTNGVTLVSNGANVTFEATLRIALNSGFSVANGGTFTASIKVVGKVSGFGSLRGQPFSNRIGKSGLGATNA